MKAPVLLIAFNRPEMTEQVFHRIREVKPLILYVAVDGPRKNVRGEAAIVENVIKIVQNVDWDCEVHYLIRETNLGCRLGVSGAISWVFENEDRAIIIEDDVVASPSFFYFAEELLEKYKHEEKISMISANNYTPLETNQEDFIFTKYGHIWGWATWKRVWDKFDLDLPYLQEDINSGILKTVNLSKRELQYYKNQSKKLLYLISTKTINTWDTQFGYYRMRNGLLSIAPRMNLASNIGTVSSRRNTVVKDNLHFYPSDEDFILVKYPSHIECNYNYDEFHFKNHINRYSLFKKSYYQILHLLKARKNVI